MKKKVDRPDIKKMESSGSNQKIWFSDITVQQWSQERSSVDFIFNHLYPHYQTHQIMNLLNQLTESEWNQKNKFVTHCLIMTTVNTFRQRITKIEGIKLYLSVCEYVNRVKFDSFLKLDKEAMAKDVLFYTCKQSQMEKNLEMRMDAEFYEAKREDLKKNSVSQAPQVLYVLKEKKLLSVEGYETCLLYSKMHDLMISKEIVEPQTTIVDLMTKSHSSLIAAFFIGKRQRNAQIFNDLFPIYTNKLLFYDSLREYINSASCSRVELQILVRELKELKLQHEEYNNYLSELLIHGFCLRTQIREKYEAHEIVLMFCEIELNLDLALKLQKFNAIKDQLTFIFEFFMCQKLTYQEVLNSPQKVIRYLMENYFNSKLNWGVLKNYGMETFTIEGREVDLQIIQNTFSVMLYLREKLYVQLSQMDISLIYGAIMIDWEQFEVLKTIFSEDQKSPESSFSSSDYFERLILKTLSEIYTKENIYMDEQTITHIQNILNLLGEGNSTQLIVREKAKLQLSKLLEDWGYTIQTVTLELICIKWRDENKEELIIEIMDNCIQYFDLEALQKLYLLLETTRIGNAFRDVRSPESIRLAYCLAEKLDAYANEAKSGASGQNKEEEISKIIYFINKNQPNYVAEFGLMAKTFLRMVIKKYTQDPTIIDKDLMSEFIDHNREDAIREQNYKNPTSNFLSVNRSSNPQLHKSFSGSGAHQTNRIQKQKDKSHFRKESSLKDSKSFYSHNLGDVSRISAKQKLIQAQDPINALKFDDPMIQQRIFNHFFKVQNPIEFSSVCTEITEEKPWYAKGKEIIEYFALSWSNPETINEMFRNKFSREVWMEVQTKYLTVSKEFYFKIEESLVESLVMNSSQNLWKVNLDLEDLWKVSVKVSQLFIYHYVQVLKHRVKEFYQALTQKYCQVLYYGHFFLLMALKYPETLLKLQGIDYEHIINLQIIYELQRQAVLKKKEYQRINFENIWKKYHMGLKKMIIGKIEEIRPETKIPEDIENKVIERLIKENCKEKSQITLYMKILIQIESYLSKYVRQEKQKMLNELKIMIESLIIDANMSQMNLLKKKSTKEKRFSQNLRITLRQIQEAKYVIKEFSGRDIIENDGLMKEIAEVFEDFKRSESLDDCDDSLKEIIVKKILSKRQLNVSSFLGENKEDKQSPYNSSFVLDNKLLNDHNSNKKINNLGNELSFENKLRLEDERNSSLEEIEYFKAHKFEFDSFIDIKMEDEKEMSDYEDDFLHVKDNFQDVLSKANLAYLHLVYPQELSKTLAIKDGRFEKKYHFVHPVSEEISNKIKEFVRYLNGYEVYSAKNSKYYMEENLKKMLSYGQDDILQILQQLYFQEDSILVTLNQKQLEANSLRRSKGLGSQEEKFKKTKFSFILALIKSLKLPSTRIFENLMNSVKKIEESIQKMKQNGQIEEKDNFEVSFKNCIQKIFPLNDLTNLESSTGYWSQIETIFGRVYLSCIVTEDEINFELFEKVIEFLIDFFNDSNDLLSVTQEDQNKYSKSDLKNYLCCMMAWQIIRSPVSSQKTKRKFEYLIENLSKQFLIEIHELTEKLLQSNSGLRTVFSIKTLSLLNS